MAKGAGAAGEGNVDRRERPAYVDGLLLAAGVVLVLGACEKDPVVTTRVVTLHAPQNCAAGVASLNATASGVYYALGDYEPSAPTTGHLLMNVGTALPEIDPAARALLVDATEQNRTWYGTTAVAPQGAVDVLLLPEAAPCALRGAVGASPASPTLLTIGVGGSQRVLLVGGASTGTVVLRLDTGEIDTLPAGQDLPAPRSGAAVTAFGTGTLVAGGIDATGKALADAYVFDPDTSGFESQAIDLGGPRGGPGAAVLATGETVLVGGVGADGKTALDSIEIVDPVTRTARTAGATLTVARTAPTVLRLASGEIFVAGGVDSSGAPVTALEWFMPDASQSSKRSQDLVAGVARTYVALEGGGALAVIAPPADAPATFENAWVVDADGALESATPVDGALPQPVLFGGAGGAPVLWTGANAAAPGRWLQWQPWAGTFGPLAEALDDTPGRVVEASTSPDPGTALWEEASSTATPGVPRLAAMRFDARGPYSTLPGPLLVTDTSELAPDRIPADGVIPFDPGSAEGGTGTGGLSLEPGASAFVSDRTYADVRVEVDAPTGQPALLVLRDALGNETEVGGATCPGAVVTGAPSSLTVMRTGATVAWSVLGGPSSPCPMALDPGARLSIGVRGAPDLIRSVASNLRVTRLGQP